MTNPHPREGEKKWTENVGASYVIGFISNLIFFAAIYKIFGWEWFLVVALADIANDLGTIIKKLYE